MKKNMVLWLTATLLFASIGNTLYAQKECIIKGNLKGIPSGTVKLVYYDETNRTSKTIDSSTIENGAFILKEKIGIPKMMSLQIVPGNWSFGFFAEDAPLTITADTTGSSHYDYTKYGEGKGAVIKKFTEQGSKNFDDYMQYQNDPGQKQFEPVFVELEKKFKAVGKDIDAEYRVRDQMDSVRKLLNAWKLKQIDAYVNKKPSSVAGVYMFFELSRFTSDMPYAVLHNMLSRFKGEAKESVYYSDLADSMSKLAAVQPGSIAPDFTLLKRDSSKYTLSSTRGKYTMIDFWASWCHPCRQAIPHWKAIYQKYNAKGFEIVSVSDDSKWKDWFKAMDDEKMPWTQVCDEFPKKHMPSRVGSLYMTTYIPYYVLLDQDGKILVSSGDENKIDEKLKEIFGEE